MKHWENVEYQTIAKAVIRDGTLIVMFSNNDEAKIELQSLLPFVNKRTLDNVATDDVTTTPYEIQIDLGSEVKVIPWDKLRVLTDKEFSRHVAQEAEEQAKLIGVKLKRLREKKGIKSNELAERSGITAQTISRIEKGHQDVSFTTLKKLLASMGYSLRDLAKEEIELENEKSEIKTFQFLLKKLSKIGIDPGFVTKRIVPKSIQDELRTFHDEQPDLLLNEAASYLSSIYGWSVSDIWNNSELSLDKAKANFALLKRPISANDQRVKAYIPYANFLAQVALKANTKKQKITKPRDKEDFITTLFFSYGGLELESLLRYAWDMGIVIIPLKDSGIFHGAAFNIKGNHVIILKQQVTSHAKWIFDLLHELYHVLVHLDEEDGIIAEYGEISPIAQNEDPKELEANSFANQVIFNGSADNYAQEAVMLARGKTEYLKAAVEDIANKRKIRVDSLANYLAYRLAYQGTKWWPTAETLQVNDPEPYMVTREFLTQNIDLKKLNPLECDVLSNALNL